MLQEMLEPIKHPLCLSTGCIILTYDTQRSATAWVVVVDLAHRDDGERQDVPGPRGALAFDSQQEPTGVPVVGPGNMAQHSKIGYSAWVRTLWSSNVSCRHGSQDER